MGVQNHIEISGQPINNLKLMMVYTIPSCTHVSFKRTAHAMVNSYGKDHVSKQHLNRNLMWFHFHRRPADISEVRTPLS